MEFEKFKEESDQLDNFFFQKVSIQNYKTLSFVVKLVLTLSHGQASVERQFSVNNQVPDNNMQAMIIVLWKHLINHTKANQLTPHSIDISKYLLLLNVPLPYTGYILKRKVRRRLTLKLKIRKHHI